MHSRHRYAKPDEWQQRIGKPVQPCKVSYPPVPVEMQIHPDIEKLVNAYARYEIYAKTICFQIFTGDIEIALKRRDAPADGAFRQHGSGVFVCDADLFHT